MDRLERLASLCKGSICVCDVGCDHAYALIKAITKYGVEKGIASEVALGPLNNAIKSINAAGLSDRIITCLSDGFKDINYEFDTAIIAGMGGALICDILTNSIEKIKEKKLILEANCEAYRVREFIKNNNFKIIFEDAFNDQGKYYEIIVCEPGYFEYNEYDIMYGPLLRKKQPIDYINHYRNKIDLIKSIIDKINDPIRKEEKEMEIREMKAVLEFKNMEKYYLLNTDNYYRTYFLDDETRPTILVAPGGGYTYTSRRESEPVVDIFNRFGYHVVVVNYRETINESYPYPGNYLAEVVKILRKDKRVSKIIGLGFSAGGHCILEMCLHNKEAKLDLLMLGYPVITADRKYAHLGSFEALLLDDVDNEELREYLSLEKQVTKDNAVDMFLWGTYTDESVPVMNSLLLIDSYLKVGGNIEYHMYYFGSHGFSVANEYSAEELEHKKNPYIANWVNLANEWIKRKLTVDNK